MNFADIADAAVSRFVDRCALLPQLFDSDTFILENPTEELVHATKSHKPVKMFMRGGKVPSRAIARLEENYLYSSRRFPTGTNNTIGSGGLAVNTYPFFGAAVNSDGSGLGFPTGFSLSLNETNMEQGGQIPQGQSFVFNQIGISFNANASIADTNSLMESASLQYLKSGGSFTLNHGPLKFWPGGHGNGGFATSTNVNFGANGVIDMRAVRNLRIARVIKSLEVFSYNFNIPRTTEARDGATYALSQFVIATIWLWGGWKSAIST